MLGEAGIPWQGEADGTALRAFSRAAGIRSRKDKRETCWTLVQTPYSRLSSGTQRKTSKIESASPCLPPTTLPTSIPQSLKGKLSFLLGNGTRAEGCLCIPPEASLAFPLFPLCLSE